MNTAFWPIAPAEDNVFALLRNQDGCMASLHASWTNWKNTFIFEAFGEAGYLKVSGLGGHYGTERLTWGTRGALGGAPEEQCFEFPGPDQSLEREWQDFVYCIEQKRTPLSDGRDGWKTLNLAASIYQDANLAGTIHGVTRDTVGSGIHEIRSADPKIESSLLVQPCSTEENSR